MNRTVLTTMATSNSQTAEIVYSVDNQITVSRTVKLSRPTSPTDESFRMVLEVESLSPMAMMFLLTDIQESPSKSTSTTIGFRTLEIRQVNNLSSSLKKNSDGLYKQL